MIRRYLVPTAASSVLSVLTACAANPPPRGAGADASCASLAAAARDEVGAAISAHAACATDADCVETSLGASCFDSCSRAVASGGAAEVDAARARADASSCRSFRERGCKLVTPPCAPPAAPRCVSGACT